jgi:adenylyltransferase/sulfurtransferase
MNRPDAPPIVLEDDRFARFRRITWWSQERLRAAKVLVVGAGALGNEVIKNLCLLGVGHLAIADMDRIEQSNLCRSVLFRASDEGQFKAEAAARAARELYPDIDVAPLVGNILADIGLGWFRWADVVVGALDNREARVFVNQSCAMVARPWIDGGIEVLHGIVRGFEPPRTACYECTMGQTDWDQLNKRRSCSLLARRAVAEGGTPTTPTTASVIGAMQAQEVVKRLHGLESLAGAGFVFEGLGHSSYAVRYDIRSDCPWHQEPAPIESAAELGADTPLREIWRFAAQRLGEPDAIDLSRELVATLSCPKCSQVRSVFQPAEHISEQTAVCPACGAEAVPDFFHSLAADSDRLDRSPRQLGLPAWEIVWARRGEEVLGIELAADRPAWKVAGDSVSGCQSEIGHSERSEESVRNSNVTEILRCAQDDRGSPSEFK